MPTPFFPFPSLAPLGTALIAPSQRHTRSFAYGALQRRWAERLALSASGKLIHQETPLRDALRGYKQAPIHRIPSHKAAYPYVYTTGHPDGWELWVGMDDSGVFVRPGATSWWHVAPCPVAIRPTVTLDGTLSTLHPSWCNPQAPQAATPAQARIQAAWRAEIMAWAEACTQAPPLCDQMAYDAPREPSGPVPAWCVPSTTLADAEGLQRMAGYFAAAITTLENLPLSQPARIGLSGASYDVFGTYHPMRVHLRGVPAPHSARWRTRLQRWLDHPNTVQRWPLSGRIAPGHILQGAILPTLHSAHARLDLARRVYAFLSSDTMDMDLFESVLTA